MREARERFRYRQDQQFERKLVKMSQCLRKLEHTLLVARFPEFDGSSNPLSWLCDAFLISSVLSLAFEMNLPELTHLNPISFI